MESQDISPIGLGCSSCDRDVTCNRNMLKICIAFCVDNGCMNLQYWAVPWGLNEFVLI